MAQQGRVVVAVDASPDSVQAIKHARRQADLAGAGLEAVISWQRPVTYGGFPLLAGRDWEAAAHRTLDAALHKALGSGARSVSRRVVNGHQVAVLAKQTVGADLLVVGSRRRSQPARMLFGTIDDRVLAAARCSVLVVAGDPSSVPTAAVPELRAA